MKKNNKKFYITTAIAYANASPHIGHALEVIQADVIARYRRNAGEEVYFLTGTDEHGDKINRVALASNKTARVFVNEISAQFKKMKKTLSLSFNDFIRTTDKKRHYPAVLSLFQKMITKGDIFLKDYQGFYCVGCEKFLTEKDLTEEGLCPFHKKAPELIEERNFFFRLSRYAKKIEEAILKNKIVICPDSTKAETLAFLRNGLEDISFSRSRKSVPWGIAIPNSDQTLYVWGDALTNYISAIGYGRDEESFKKWWPADAQVIGKDIFRFHAIIWPAMLMSLNLPLPKKLLVHGFITIDNEKMSKSLGNVISVDEAVNRYGVDALRYFLIREIPSDSDGDFSFKRFDERYQSDLAKGLGNFVARTLNLLNGQKISISHKVTASIKQDAKRMEARIKKGMEEFRLHEALSAVFDFIKSGDVYVNTNQPWKNKSDQVSRDMIFYLENISHNLDPFMPNISHKILKAIALKDDFYKPRKIDRLFPIDSQ